MSSPPNKIRLSLGLAHGIFALVFLLRLLALARLTQSPFLLPDQGDMHFYNDWALRILKGEWTDYHAFYGLPLYAYLLAGLYKLFGYTPFLPGFIQACLDGGTAVLLYKLAVRTFGVAKTAQGGHEPVTLEQEHCRTRGKVVGILAAIGWGFFQPAEAYAIILMPTAWLVFIFWLVVWQVIKRERSPGYVGLLLLGALIGFTSMGIATVLFLVPLVIAAVYLKWKPAGQTRYSRLTRFVSTLVVFLGIGLGSAPSWLHNYFIAHDAVFLSAHSGVNFWIGNNPVANGYPKFPPGLHAGQEGMLKDSISQAEAAAGRPLKRSEVSTYWSGKARSYIRMHPWEWLKLIGHKVNNFWNAFQYDDLSIVSTLREENVIFPGLGFGIIAALAVPGLLLAFVNIPLSRWIASAIVLHVFSILSVFVTERYRLAAVPGLLLFAGFGLQEFWYNCVNSNYRWACQYCGCLIISIYLISLPQSDSSLWALDSYNTGLQALQANHLELAQRKLARAYSYVPENAEINFALGNLRLAQKNIEAAKSFYLLTLRRDPQHEGACNNLGVLALQEQQWRLAEKCFREAIRRNPNDATTRYLLARSLVFQEQFGAGAAELKIARAINPQQREFIELQKLIELRQPR